MDKLLEKTLKVFEDISYDKRLLDISHAAFQQLGRLTSTVKMIERKEVDFDKLVGLIKWQKERFEAELNKAGE